MFLSETWLEDTCSATVLNETAPPNFNCTSVRQTVRRGGGAFNVELATARQTFFSNPINSNLNTRTLFVTVERLTNHPKSGSQ